MDTDSLATGVRNKACHKQTCPSLSLQEQSWQDALREVVAESTSGEEQPLELPEAVLAAVAGSPILLNLSTALAHHKRLLAAAAIQQAAAGDGLPVRLREQLRANAEDLSTTLRTILCL